MKPSGLFIIEFRLHHTRKVTHTWSVVLVLAAAKSRPILSGPPAARSPEKQQHANATALGARSYLRIDTQPFDTLNVSLRFVALN